MAASMVPRSSNLPNLPAWDLSASHSELHEPPVDQTAYMPFRRKLFCCWSDFKIKNSSETLIVLPKELGYLKRSGPVLSLTKKKNAVFHSFLPSFLRFFSILYIKTPFVPV